MRFEECTWHLRQTYDSAVVWKKTYVILYGWKVKYKAYNIWKADRSDDCLFKC